MTIIKLIASLRREIESGTDNQIMLDVHTGLRNIPECGVVIMIGYVTCSIREYESKNQRGLMTRALRKQIMERDNYTCQICGKYMPDEVGLQIDHIIPVSHGGKTVPSNLRVLCNRCNGHKGSKFDHQCW